MTKEDKILVCIPAYNAEESITASVNSVLNQSIKNFKILVVDNNSTDETSRVVEKIRYANNNSEKIELIINPVNLGRIQNWNKCIELFLSSDFDYLKFLFTGDILNKDGLEILLSGFRKCDYKIGVAVAGYNNIDGGIIKKVKKFDKEECLDSKEGLLSFVKRGNWVGSPLSCMFSRGAVRDIRFDKNFDFASDYKFFVEVVSKFNALCVREVVGDFSTPQRKHLQKYKSTLFAKLEELHTRYGALEMLKRYLPESETNQLTKYLNKESLKILAVSSPFVDVFEIFAYKIRMSSFSILTRLKKNK